MEKIPIEFVPYELALRMKALGFDEPCLAVFELIVVGDVIPKFRYNWDGEDRWFNHNKAKCEYDTHDWYWSAPTFSQAFRWFRKTYPHIKFHFKQSDWKGDYTPFFDNYIKDEKNIRMEGCGGMNSYEEAELNTLTRLINIVESKSK